MSTLAEINELIVKQNEAFHEFKKVNEQKLAETKAGNESRVKELDAKLARIEETITKTSELKTNLQKELDFQRERLEELEARAKAPGKTVEEKAKDEYKDTFFRWIRSGGQDLILGQKMQDIQASLRQMKAVTIASDSGGGYAVPEEINRAITVMQQKLSPVRGLVKVVQVGTSDYKELLDLNGASCGWVAESGTRNATTTPLLRQVTPTQGELYAYPQISEWSADDMFFNVEDWIVNSVAKSFAKAEGIAVISGNGSSQPTGLLNTTPVTTADDASPLRAAAAYQYFASDLTPGSQGVTADSLFDAVYGLNSAYRAGASWILNSATLGKLRQIKDSNGQYLWQPGLQMGQPDRILGYPLSTWEDMPDIGSNNFPIGFGNWSEAYVLVDRVGTRITRDNVTAIGHIKFYVRRREGGMPLNNDAAKFIRTV